MARGDAIFARCNVDWPDDPRCVDLPNNDVRWLNHCLWLWCTKSRSPILPERYTVRYMAKSCDISEVDVEAALRHMAMLDLILISGTSLVLSGVTNQNSRLEWKLREEEIPDLENPWKLSPKYLWDNGVPVEGISVPNRKEQRKEHRKEQEDGQEPQSGTRPPDEVLRDPKDGRPYEMPLKAKGASCTIPRSKGLEWDHCYGDSFNVPVELRKCIQYYRDNPAKRKTDKQNAVRAIGNWLRKTQNDSSGQPALSRAEKRKMKDRLDKAREADEAQAQRHKRTGSTTDGPELADFESVVRP